MNAVKLSSGDLRKSQLDLLLAITRISKGEPYGVVAIEKIAQTTQRAYPSIQNSLQVLHRSGWVRRMVRGGYCLTEAAKEIFKTLGGVE